MNKPNFVLIALSAMSLMFLIGTSSPANASNVYGVRITGQGEMRCDIKSYTPSETGGNNYNSENCRIIHSTQQIKASVGSEYGCKYDVIGSLDGSQFNMLVRYRIPSPGVINPSTGQHFLIYDRFHRKYVGSKDNHNSWKIDHEGEIVPGEWRIEFLYEDRLLGSCTFYVSR